MTRVAVGGATGWTGAALCAGIRGTDDLHLVAGVSRTHAGSDLGEVIAGTTWAVPVHASVAAALDNADVYVDFTKHHAVKTHVLTAIAFYYYVMESFIDGGVALGLDRELATALALQTLIGSAELIKRTGETPEQLRINVTSPGGTTAAAIAKFEELGLRDTLIAGQIACRDRGAELSQL